MYGDYMRFYKGYMGIIWGGGIIGDIWGIIKRL